VEIRKTVLATLTGSFVALSLTMILVVTLPFRLRPLYQPAFNFRPPFGIPMGVLDGWSSFPSDHATLPGDWLPGFFLFPVVLVSFRSSMR